MNVCDRYKYKTGNVSGEKFYALPKHSVISVFVLEWCQRDPRGHRCSEKLAASKMMQVCSIPLTFTFMLSKATYSAFRLYMFYQYVCSLGIEPTTFCAANATLPLNHRNMFVQYTLAIKHLGSVKYFNTFTRSLFCLPKLHFIYQKLQK